MSIDGRTESTSLEVPNEESPRSRSFSDVVEQIENEDIGRDLQSYSYDPTSKKNLDKLGRVLFNAGSSKSVTGKRSTKIRSVLKNLSPLYNEKYKTLEKRVVEWKDIRIPFMTKLDEFIKRLDKNSKWCSAIRLLASTADVTGSVGGLLMSPESSWGKYAFNSASVCGLCGLISTVLEVGSSKKILDEVTAMREEDYSLFASVVRWFQENQELDTAVQDLFPYGIDKEVALEIQEASTELEEYLKVFESVFLSNVRKDNDLLGDKDFLHSLRIFSTSDVASLWWNRIIFRKHPFHLDLNRITLQMEFGQMQSLFFQSIPALPLEQQRLTSLPVAGRIMLNFLTMHDAYSYLSSGAKSLHSDKLRKLLKGMKRELQIVEEALREMNPTRTRRRICDF